MFVQKSTSPLLLSKGMGLSRHSAGELCGGVGRLSVELAGYSALSVFAQAVPPAL